MLKLHIFKLLESDIKLLEEFKVVSDTNLTDFNDELLKVVRCYDIL